MTRFKDEVKCFTLNFCKDRLSQRHTSMLENVFEGVYRNLCVDYDLSDERQRRLSGTIEEYERLAEKIDYPHTLYRSYKTFKDSEELPQLDDYLDEDGELFEPTTLEVILDVEGVIRRAFEVLLYDTEDAEGVINEFVLAPSCKPSNLET